MCQIRSLESRIARSLPARWCRLCGATVREGREVDAGCLAQNRIRASAARPRGRPPGLPHPLVCQSSGTQVCSSFGLTLGLG